MIAKKVHRLDFVEGSIYILTSVQRAIFFRKICPHFTWGPYPKENRVYYSIFFCTIWAVIVQLVMFSRFFKKRKENYKASFFLIRFQNSTTITKPCFMVELCSHMILAVGITMPRWSWLSDCRKNELFLCMFIANHASGHQKSPSAQHSGVWTAKNSTMKYRQHQCHKMKDNFCSFGLNNEKFWLILAPLGNWLQSTTQVGSFKRI